MADGRRRVGWIGIGVVWLVAVIGAVLVLVADAGGAAVGTIEDGPYGTWAALGVVFGTAVLLTLVAQLASRRPEGFVRRASASVGGAAVVVGVAALAAIPLG
ncbi:hypothetical protein ACGGZK_09155 [Agromyces sp. MMS24-K17]|uniref:hypothetical protein n=1 Tax=Agromyces sp. MMS24-K17 TaxID=3372850 RepID=UPI003754D9D3